MENNISIFILEKWITFNRFTSSKGKYKQEICFKEASMKLNTTVEALHSIMIIVGFNHYYECIIRLFMNARKFVWLLFNHELASG